MEDGAARAPLFDDDALPHNPGVQNRFAEGGRSALVVGAAGGIGAALLAELRDAGFASVHAWSRQRPAALAVEHTWQACDLEHPETIATAAETLQHAPPLGLVVVATGLLHGPEQRPERRWEELDPAWMLRSFAVNSVGPAAIAKHVLPYLAPKGPAAFAVLGARVGSITDNRLGGWYAYRASKAALCMLVKTLAVELARRKPDAHCVALHPGTVATKLSAPFGASVKHPVHTAERAARDMLRVLAALGPADSGGHFAYDGSRIEA